jgi:hypothetical protein
MLLPMDHPDEMRIRMTGLPEAVPERKGAVRMAAADGEWRLVSDGVGVDVRFELYVDPGKVPRYFANRRLSRTLGKTLANLQATFPCGAAPDSGAGAAP